MSAPPPPREDDRFPVDLAIAFTLLVAYASLHPFNDWRDSGAPLFEWVTAAWPRYLTRFDLITNILAYVPLGFIWSTALQTRRPRWRAALAASLMAGLLSFSLETIQNFLPSRVPSNVDLGCNTLGGLIGALLAINHGQQLLSGGQLDRWRRHWFRSGQNGDWGLIVIGLWLLAQLNPETLLFGEGDLRSLLGLEGALSFDIERFPRIETAITGANTLALGLMLSCLLRRRALIGVLSLFALATGIRSLAHALMLAPDHALQWLTPGNSLGLALGLGLLIPTLWAPAILRRLLAGMALLFATILVNLAPENPYLALTATLWQSGHFLNFNGLTRLTSALWPFLALPWLMLRERDPWPKFKP